MIARSDLRRRLDRADTVDEIRPHRYNVEMVNRELISGGRIFSPIRQHSRPPKPTTFGVVHIGSHHCRHKLLPDMRSLAIASGKKTSA